MTPSLTDSQKQTIRKSLAKWMGWTELQEIEDCLAGLPPNAKWLEDIPNYPTSLDACAELEAKMTGVELVKYTRELRDVCWAQGEDGDDVINLIRASASQRALALFRALNLGELGD